MRQPDQLSLLTWNVHSCIGTDRRFDAERVARFLLRVDADIVALQELGWHHRGRVGFDQFAFLAEKTGYQVHEGLTKNHERAHYGNAILSRLPLVALAHHDLCRPMRIPRGAIEATFQLPRAFRDLTLRVLNVHLGLDPWERRQQVDALLPALDAEPDQPTVLMGDTNEWRAESATFRRLERRLPNVAAPPSFHTRLPRLRYDRIYLSEALALEDFGAVSTHEARVASDHLPVLARVRLAAASTASPATDPS